MPFLAPALPFIGKALPWVSKALPIVGGLFGKGQTGQQQDATKLISDLVGEMRGRSAELSPYGKNFMRTAQTAFPQALNFWAPLLGGSRTAATSVMAPDISRINEQFDSILQGTKGDRTGAGASIYAAAPYQKQAQIQSIFSNIRPQAAEAVQNIGQQTGALGTATFQTILQALSHALGGGQGLLNQANLARNQSQEAGKSFATGLSGIFDALGPLFKKGGSTTASGTPGSIFGDIWGAGANKPWGGASGPLGGPIYDENGNIIAIS